MNKTALENAVEWRLMKLAGYATPTGNFATPTGPITTPKAPPPAPKPAPYMGVKGTVQAGTRPMGTEGKIGGVTQETPLVYQNQNQVSQTPSTTATSALLDNYKAFQN